MHHLSPEFFSAFKLGDCGFIDRIEQAGDMVSISGWSACIEENPPIPPQKLVFVHGNAILFTVDSFTCERADVSAAYPKIHPACGFSVEVPLRQFGSAFDPVQLEGFAVSHSSAMYQMHKAQQHCFLLQLEPTGACNLRCPQCPNTMYSGFNNRDISLEDIELVAPLIQKATTICYDGFGEFFMSKNIWNALKKTPLKAHVLIHTNGLLVDRYFDRILDNAPPVRQLVFSLDSLQKERYDRIRQGSNLDQVLANMRELKRRRDARGQRLPYIVPNMKIMNLNFDELRDFMDLAREMDGFLELVYLYDAAKLAGQTPADADPMLSYEEQQPRYQAKEIADALQEALAYGAAIGVVTHFAGAITEPMSGKVDTQGYIASTRPVAECPMVDCSAALQLDGKFMYCVWQTAPVFNWREADTVNPAQNARAAQVRRMIQAGQIPYECSGACCHFVGRKLSEEAFAEASAPAGYRGGWQSQK